MLQPLTLSLGIVLAVLPVSAVAANLPGSSSTTPPLVIKKLLVTDCRVVRGFLGTPADGTVNSRDYRGTVREYPRSASDGVAYSFNRNDGIHITLSDAEGFDEVVLRGGAKARLYADYEGLREPANTEPFWTFHGSNGVQVARLGKRIKSKRISLFGISDGNVADISFYRTSTDEPTQTPADSWHPGQPLKLDSPASEFAPEKLSRALDERYGKERHRVLQLTREAGHASLTLESNEMLHLITPVLEPKRGLAAVTFDAVILGARSGSSLTLAIQDPLNPTRDIMWIALPIPASGRVRWICDVPDQVLFAGTRIWISLGTDARVTLSGPAGGPRIELCSITREQALPEAIAQRKFLLKSLFSLLSEPRPWGRYGKQSREEYFKGDRYAAQCPELFMTLDQCHALAPEDQAIRQYREWIYAEHLDTLSSVTPPPTPP